MKTKEYTRIRIAAYISAAVILISLAIAVASWFMPHNDSADSVEGPAPTTSESNPLMDKTVGTTQQAPPPSQPQWKVPNAPGGGEDKIPDPMAR